MKKLIYNKVDKTMLLHLKRVEFYGRITVVNTTAEAERAVDYLLSQPILGFDTETRPAFEKGKHYRCALLQVATLIAFCTLGSCASNVMMLDTPMETSS